VSNVVRPAKFKRRYELVERFKARLAIEVEAARREVDERIRVAEIAHAKEMAEGRATRAER
jgi:hypothetical protein